ncbi:uncharacterized protein SCODWIG_01093 [Saccharomycodes ludwigii]|uniref:Spindle assembly checkpoint component MAD1 n=1 Tax=Saccharomycodes ludwigii TaxID=36035 RepID=A0A376B3Z1_9ASCO|nr:uncharacterized protein SCODWIG_01093 [Saccharomycodes ludwigii]
MTDSNNDDGGSSPFLEEPALNIDNGSENDNQHIFLKHSDITTMPTAINNKTSSNDSTATIIMEKNELHRKLMSLNYTYNTLKNDCEIKELYLTTQLENMTKKYNEKLEEVDKYLNECSNLLKENENLGNNLQKITDEKQALENKNTTVTSDVHDLKGEILQLKGKIHDLNIGKQELNGQLNNLKLELDTSKDLNNRYGQDLNTKSLELKKNLNKINELESHILELEMNKNIDNTAANIQNYNEQDISLLRREITNHVSYIQELESTNLKQATELKHLKQKNENIDFLNVENSNLRTKLDKIDKDLKPQLETLELENIKLKEQLLNLDKDSASTATVTKTLMMEKTLLINENTNLKLKCDNLETKVHDLDIQNKELLGINEKYEQTVINLKKINNELEQQKSLSFEECDLLKKQIQDLEQMLNSNSDNKLLESTSSNSNEWNSVIDQYKTQTENLTNELKKLNELSSAGSKKRKLTPETMLEDKDKFAKIQFEKLELEREITTLKSENMVLKDNLSKLSNLKEQKIRILQLRDNPLSKNQFIKKTELTLLKQENEELLGKLPISEKIPRSVYERLVFEKQQLENTTFQKNKQMLRLKQMFNSKSLEFIDTVNTILGFKIEFIAGNKVKLISCYEPSKALVMDLVNNTLKSSLSKSINSWDDLLNYWVNEKSQIPCLLASVQLKLYEQKYNQKGQLYNKISDADQNSDVI